jgi:hypothetical protein
MFSDSGRPQGGHFHVASIMRDIPRGASYAIEFLVFLWVVAEKIHTFISSYARIFQGFGHE